MLPTTAAAGLIVGLGVDGLGKELLATVLAAKVERLSIAFGVKGGGGIHGHAADGVDGFGCRRIHDAVSLVLVCCFCLSDSGIWDVAVIVEALVLELSNNAKH